MAKTKKLTAVEVQDAINSLELEDQLFIFYSTKEVIDGKQRYIADQLKKIEDNNAKMNGK
jgi:hypothetical protein